MDDSFAINPEIRGMKIFLAQQNYHIGNFEYNTQKIINAIEIAKAAGGDLILSCKRFCRVPRFYQ